MKKQVIAGIPGVIINSLAGSLTAYGLAGLRPDISAIAVNSAIVCVQSLISIQLQVFCVWLTPNQDLAYVLATGYVASSILLSGFYLRTRDMQLRVMRVLSHLSYTKYAMEGVAQVELRGQKWDGCGGALGEAAKAAKAFAGMGEALGGGAAAAAAPAAAAGAAPAPASLGALLNSAPSTSNAAPAPPAAIASPSSDPADQLKSYLSDHADAAQMYNQNPSRAQDWLSAHGYGAAVDALRARGENGPIDLNAWKASKAAAAAATSAVAAAAPAPGANNFWTEAPRRMGLAARRATRLQGEPQAGDADAAASTSGSGSRGAVIPEIGGTLSDLQVASGGVFTGCDSTGDSVLSFWGYSLTVGQVGKKTRFSPPPLFFFFLFQVGEEKTSKHSLSFFFPFEKKKKNRSWGCSSCSTLPFTSGPTWRCLSCTSRRDRKRKDLRRRKARERESRRRGLVCLQLEEKTRETFLLLLSVGDVT